MQDAPYDGPANPCFTCIDQADKSTCASQYNACSNDANCQNCGNCLNMGMTSAQCQSMYPTGCMELNAYSACLCQTFVCQSVCTGQGC